MRGGEWERGNCGDTDVFPVKGGPDRLERPPKRGKACPSGISLPARGESVNLSGSFAKGGFSSADQGMTLSPNGGKRVRSDSAV